MAQLTIQELKDLLVSGTDSLKEQMEQGDVEDAAALASLIKYKDELEVRLNAACERSDSWKNSYNSLLEALIDLHPTLGELGEITPLTPAFHLLKRSQAICFINLISKCLKDNDVSLGTPEEIRVTIGVVPAA